MGLREVLRRVAGFLRRPHGDVLSFEREVEAAGVAGRADGGMRTIPAAKIVGSVGRAATLRSDFFYKSGKVTGRYVRIGKAMERGEALPPIEVYRARPHGPQQRVGVGDGLLRVGVVQALLQRPGLGLARLPQALALEAPGGPAGIHRVDVEGDRHVPLGAQAGEPVSRGGHLRGPVQQEGARPHVLPVGRDDVGVALVVDGVGGQRVQHAPPAEVQQPPGRPLPADVVEPPPELLPRRGERRPGA